MGCADISLGARTSHGGRCLPVRARNRRHVDGTSGELGENISGVLGGFDHVTVRNTKDWRSVLLSGEHVAVNDDCINAQR